MNTLRDEIQSMLKRHERWGAFEEGKLIDPDCSPPSRDALAALLARAGKALEEVENDSARLDRNETARETTDCKPAPEKVYTPKNHPWRGRIITGYPPGTYRIDGRLYCPTAWIIEGKPDIFAVMNTKQECVELVKSYGAKVKWIRAAATERKE
jgi:hypothetical protein